MWYNTGTTSLYKGSRYGYPVFLCYNVNEETVFDTGILSFGMFYYVQRTCLRLAVRS